MCYVGLNDNIRNQIGEDNPRHRMIRYALDQQYLPDAAYNAFGGTVQNAQHLSGIPWFLGLFWVRRFYDLGRGNNYIGCLKSAFNENVRPELTQNPVYQLWDEVEDAWGIPARIHTKRGQRFLTECWLVNSGEGDSQIWKVLPAIVRAVGANDAPADIGSKVTRLAQNVALPFCFQYLAGMDDPDFAATILALKGQQGDGWLQAVALNRIWAANRANDGDDGATVAWGLYVNGAQMDAALNVANIQTTAPQAHIRLTQQQRPPISIPDAGDGRVLLVSELASAGYDPASPATVAVGRWSEQMVAFPVSTTTPRLFRHADTGEFHRWINTQEEDQI